MLQLVLQLMHISRHHACYSGIFFKVYRAKVSKLKWGHYCR